jgi:hypothetical protein
MRFAVGLVTDFEDAGFETSNWRKSIDGTKTLCHDVYAELLLPSVPDGNGGVVERFKVYDAPSDELTSLLNSPEWTPVEPI